MALMDLRAREIAKWRKDARALAARLEVLRDIAGENDKTLLMMHKLALLLVAKKGSWRGDAEKLLRRHFSLLVCRWCVFSAEQKEIVRAAGKLPAGGLASDKPLAAFAALFAAATPPDKKSKKTKPPQSYFYLPLPGNGGGGKKSGGKKSPAGLLFFAAAGKDAFAGEASDDFARRLAELLAAAG